MEKTPDATYRQLWRLVDGAVRDTFANHPEYLTQAGNRSARHSIIKRVVGTLHGYATQVARGRSVPCEDALVVAAAMWTGIDLSRAGPFWGSCTDALDGLRCITQSLWKRWVGRFHEIQGWPK